MAKKKRKNWIEERDNIVSGASKLTNLTGSYQERVQAKNSLDNDYKDEIVHNTPTNTKANAFNSLIKSVNKLPNINQLQKTITSSYNSLSSTKLLAKNKADLEKALNNANKFKATYGSDKNIETTLDYLNNIKGILDSETKGGSAATNMIIDRQNALSKGDIGGAIEAEAKGNMLNEYNLDKKFGGMDYKSLKKAKTKTPAEEDFVENKKLTDFPLETYADNAKKLKELKNKRYESTGFGGTSDGEYERDEAFKEKAKEQNAFIMQTIGNEIGKKAKLTDNEVRRLTSGGSFGLGENEYNWNFTADERPGHPGDATLSKSEMIKVLQERGLDKKEASVLLDYYKNIDKEEQRKAAELAGERTGRLNSTAANLANDIAGTIGQPIIKGLEGITNVPSDYSYYSEQGRNKTKKEDMGAVGSTLYDMAETAGTITAAGLWGPASFVPFAAKAADDSYNNAIARGADEDEALNYATNSAIQTGLIYSIGLKNINKLTSKAVKGGEGILRNLSREIVEGKATSSLGKAILTDMAKTGVKQGADFAMLASSNQIADTLNQIATLGKHSDFELQKRELMQQGLSEDEAESEVIGNIAQSIAQNTASSFASGAVLGAITSGIGSARNAKVYNEQANLRDKLENEYNKYQSTDSDFFNDVESIKDLEEQYKSRAKELHPDTVNGSEEAFKQLAEDKERIKNVLSGEYSEEALKAIDNWETFVNAHREALGLDKVMTTKEKQELDNDFSNAKQLMLETSDMLRDQGHAEEAERVENQVKLIEPAVEATEDIVALQLPQASNNLLPESIEEQIEEQPINAPKNVTIEDELNDRQAEIVARGAMSDMSDKSLNLLLQNDIGKMSPTEYSNDFRMLYALGKDSSIASLEDAVKQVPEIREVINDMSPEIAGVAFSAGRNDIKINKVNEALKNKPSGKFTTDFEPRKDEMYVHEILSDKAKLSGLDVIVVDGINNYKGLENAPKTAQGVSFMDDGKIVLDRNVANILGVAAHEMDHFIEKFAPEEYKTLEQAVSKIYRDDLGIKGYDKFINGIKDNYKASGVDIDYDEARKEGIAFGMETLFLNDKAMETFVDEIKMSTATEAQKKNILHVIFEWLKKAIEQIKQRIKNVKVRPGTEGMLSEDINTVDIARKYLKGLEAMKSKIESMDITEGAEGQSKFSLSEPVEETKDLIAVHNLSPDELMQSIDLGGIPMPSIAITKAKLGHTNFGSVSIILDKQFIDPKANRYNRVYGGDAWTPSFPSVEYKLNYDATRDLYDKTGFDTNSYDNLTPESIIEKMENKESVVDSFLDKEGIKIDDVLVDKKPKISAFKQKNVKKFIKDNNINIVKLFDSPKLQEELYSKIKQDAEQSDSNFLKITADKTIDKIKSVILDGYGDNYSFDNLDRDLNIVLNPEKEKDYYATLDKKKEYIDKNKENYNNYLKEVTKDIFEDKYIVKSNEELFYPDGTRKSFNQLHRAYTLDNIVDEMSSQTEQGLADWFGGATTLRAAQEKSFDSIEDIKKNKDKIQKLTFEEVEKIRSDIDKELTEICDEISTEYDHDAIGESLLDAFRSKDLSKESLQSAFNWSNNNPKPIIITDKIAKRIQDFSEKLANIPRPYFEAKPRYAIRNEQLKKHALIVLPSSAKKVINELDNQGFNYQTYDDSKGEEEAKKERLALQNNNNLKFSLAPKTDSEGRELSKEQREYFKDSKVRDRLGRLLEVYHGSPEGDFTVFLPGAFFTDDYFNADGYGAGEMVYAVYLNIEKPLEIDCKGAKWDNLDTPYGTSTQEIASNLDTSKYDGIIFRNINDSWIDDEEAGDSGDVYWTTNSNQIKSVTNTNPTSNEDIRHSLSQQDASDKIENFKQVHEDIGRQLKLVQGAKLDTRQIKSIAQKLKKELGSKIDTVELGMQLNKLFTMIENKKGNINNTDVMDKAHQIVRDVMEQAREVEPEVKQFLNDMRTRKIYVSDKDKAEIGDYNFFRKNAFGKLRLVNSKEGAMPIDEFFEDLENYHPEVYDSVVGRDQNADAGRLVDLVDWIDAARQGGFSMYDMEGDSAVEHYALELLNTYANAKVEDITNNKAKQRELYKNIGEMVDFAQEQQKEIRQNKFNAQKEINSLMADINAKQKDISLKLEEQKQSLQDSYNKTLREEISKVKGKYSDRQAKAIAKLKAEQKQRNRKVKEQRERTERRQQTRKIRDRVKTTIKKPTVHKYIPKELIKPVTDLFNSIDLGEQFTMHRLNTMRDNAFIRYQGEELDNKLKELDKRELKFVTELKAFKDKLEDYAKKAEDDSSTYFKPVINLIEGTIDRVGQKSLMVMDAEELKLVNNTLRAIEKATTERNRPQSAKFEDEKGKPLETFEEIARTGLKQVKQADLGKISKLVTSHMNGRNLLKAMGGFNPNSVFAQLADKFDEAYKIESQVKMELNNFLSPVLSEKANKVSFKSDNARKYDDKHLVDVGFEDQEGKPILLNHDSLIFEYLNLESDDNLTHAARGGITFPDYKNLYNRKGSKAVYGNGVRTGNIDKELTAIERQMQDAYDSEDYNLLRSLAANKSNIMEARKKELRQIRRNIAKELTDYDREVIKAWRTILEESTKKLNEYWAKTYGYEPFTVAFYWRIITDPNFIKGNDGGNMVQAITNLSESGSTIARQEGAGNPILSGSALFAIDDYINNTAKLIAYSGLQRDLNAIMKYKLPGYKNVQKAVEQKMPKVSEDFYTLQQDIFGGRPGTDGIGNRVISTLRGLSARSVLSPNLRVALAQIPSYLGTYRYTDAKALINAFLPKNRVKLETIAKYTPLMYARGASGFSLETADLKADSNALLRGLNNVNRLSNGFIYDIPTKLDTATVRTTFGAYLDYARRMNPNLREGTPEEIARGESPLYKKAAEDFNKGTTITQPMFNPFSRNAWQRSKNELAKTLTIFHTQPLQYLNLLIQDIGEYKYAKENGNAAQGKEAKNRAFKSIASVLAANTLFILMKMAVDKTVRHKKDELEPDYIAEQLLSSYANMFIMGSTLVDGLYSLMTRGNIQDFEIYGTSTINELYDFAEQVKKAVDGKEVDVKQNILKVLSGLGIPASNVDKDLGGLIRNVQDVIDNGQWDYSNEPDKSSDLSEEAQVGQDYALGKIDAKELNKYIDDIEVPEGADPEAYKKSEESKVKNKIKSTVEKEYNAGVIDNEEAFKTLKDSNMFHSTKSYQTDDEYIEGIIAKWQIDSYKDAWIDTYGDKNGAKERTLLMKEIKKLPYKLAFPENPNIKPTYKAYKSSEQKLLEYVKKWVK